MDLNRQYSYIAFDLDGTLMDTYPGVADSFTKTEQRMGLRHLTEPERRSVIGPALEDSFERLYGLTGAENQRALDIFNALYATREGAGHSIPYPGVRETLEKLRARGCKLSVATMKPWVFTRIALEANGMRELFDSVGCYEDNSGLSKAQLVQRSMDEMGCPGPDCALLIGDSPIDARGAAELGMDFAAVTGGFGFDDPAALPRLAHVAQAETIPGLWPFLDARLPR